MTSNRFTSQVVTSEELEWSYLQSVFIHTAGLSVTEAIQMIRRHDIIVEGESIETHL